MSRARDLANSADKDITGTLTVDDITLSGNITVGGTVDGRDLATDGTKLDGVEANATADQTKADIDALNINADTLDGQHGSYYTAYADTAVSNLVDSAPTTLDTLNELAAALGDDPNFATTTATNIGTKVSKSGDTMTGALNFGDNVKAQFGASSDLQIYHDGLHSYIKDAGTGNFELSSNGDGFYFRDGSSNYLLTLSNGGPAQLWYNGSAKLATTSAGINVTGSVTASDVYVANGIIHDADTNTSLQFNSDEVILRAGGSNEVTVNTTGVRLGDTGNGYFRPVSGSYGSIEIDGGAHGGWEGYSIGGRAVFMHNNDTISGLYNDVNNQWFVQCINQGKVQLNYNTSAKFETTSGGVAVTGALTATGNITAYYSDERLKTKTGDLEGALEKIKQLNGFYYVENDLAKELGFDNDQQQVALSAQEVQAVMPEAVSLAPFDMAKDEETGDTLNVSASGEDYLTVDYARLVPLLVEAIKELKAEIEELKNGSTN